MNNYHDKWRVCLRIGNDLVASNVHYDSQPEAKIAQRALLNSDTFRGLEHGHAGYGVRVMHQKTMRRLIKEGTGTTVKQLMENERRYGRSVARQSHLFCKVDDLTSNLAEEFA